VIATRGAGLERKHAGIKQVVYSPLGAHSEKPWEVRHRLELLYGDVPRIELFSRSAAGWDAWGNEVDGDVKLVLGDMKMPSRNCPELTAEMVRELLEYDPTTGLLTWKTCRKSPER
jgi:hypothetical protein